MCTKIYLSFAELQKLGTNNCSFWQPAKLSKSLNAFNPWGSSYNDQINWNMTPFSITTKRNHHDIIYLTSGLKGNIIWYVDLLGHNNNYFLTIIYKGFISPFDEKVMAYYFSHNFGLFL